MSVSVKYALLGVLVYLSKQMSPFGIFKQNRENPDEIGMVGQSAIGFSEPRINRSIINCISLL